jgi:hypothetical protein
VLELDNDEGRERDPDANGLGEKVRSLRGEVDGHAIHDTHADRDVSYRSSFIRWAEERKKARWKDPPDHDVATDSSKEELMPLGARSGLGRVDDEGSDSGRVDEASVVDEDVGEEEGAGKVAPENDKVVDSDAPPRDSAYKRKRGRQRGQTSCKQDVACTRAGMGEEREEGVERGRAYP